MGGFFMTKKYNCEIKDIGIKELEDKEIEEQLEVITDYIYITQKYNVFNAPVMEEIQKKAKEDKTYSEILSVYLAIIDLQKMLKNENLSPEEKKEKSKVYLQSFMSYAKDYIDTNKELKRIYDMLNFVLSNIGSKAL